MILSKTFLLAICSVCLLHCSGSSALIVPQELPSILSLVYSNIPPIKKGTDSRLGFGFRLGEHADFQVLLELGPQKNTRPIGDKDSENSFSKRQIGKAEENALLRQQIKQLKRIQDEQQHQREMTSTERNAASWLENWSQDMNTLNKKTSKSTSKKTETKNRNEKTNPMVQLPLVPVKSLEQLQLLYKMATTTTTTISPTDELLTSKEIVVDLNPRNIAQRLKNKKELTKELMDVRLADGA